MQTVLIAIHLLIVIALVAVVLLQRSEGGALGVGGGSGFMTGRGQANVLTRATAILAALFFITSLGLTLIARYGHGNRLDFNGVGRPGQAEQAPKLPPTQSNSVLDQVRALEQQRSTPAGGTSGSSPSPSAGTATPPTTTTAPTTTAPTGTAAPAPTEPSGMPNRVAPDAKTPASSSSAAPAPAATPAPAAAPAPSPAPSSK